MSASRSRLAGALALGAAALAAAGVLPDPGGDVELVRGFGLGLVDVAVHPDGGRFAIAYEQDLFSYDDDVYARSFHADGTPVGAAILVNSYTIFNQWRPSVAASAEGFVVVWDGNADPDHDQVSTRHVQFQRFDWDGARLGAEQVATGTLTVAGGEASVDSLPGGGFVIAWIGPRAGGDPYEAETWARRFGSDGLPLGAEQPGADDASFTEDNIEVGAAPDGSFLVVWDRYQDTDIRMRRFSSDGAALGIEERVNPPELEEKDASNPELAMGADGSFAVSWWARDPRASDPRFGDDALKLRRYGSDGLPVGEVLRVNSDTTGRRGFPSVASLEDGSVLMAWRRYLDGETSTIGRRVAADGSFVGAETSLTDLGATPVLAADGREVRVVWNYNVPASIDDLILTRLLVPRLFTDGFESGDTMRWALAYPEP